MNRPNIFKLKSWKRHESRVLEVFLCALRRLEADEEPPEREDDLNRRLLQHARSENYRLCRRGGQHGLRSNIYYEANNQPSMDDIDRAKREDKIPDFTCGLVDAQAGVDLFLHIECKRLGKPSSTSWVLNENYIQNGVRRFIDEEWAYGKDTVSGIMIGYLQTMDSPAALSEVNGHGKSANVPPLESVVERSRVRAKLSRFEHDLARNFRGTPFRLRHVWIDLRHRYPTAPNAVESKVA